ncbi:hypothetical protein ACHQM5_000782 [Ranunculus cassubicifolius]
MNRSLEINLISAEDLRKGHGRRFISKNAFATVSTAPNNAQSTTMDTDGGSFPSWFQTFDVPLPSNVKHIKIDVNYKNGSNVKVIGSANIPVSEFLDDYVPPTCIHFLSYRLRDYNGYPNGIVNLSIRMKGGENYGNQQFRVQPSFKNSNACTSAPVLGFQGGYHSNGGDVPMGVPMYNGYVV